MSRLFQPVILLILFCALVLGFLSPLNFEKPRFFNSEIKTTIESYGNDDPAYNLYNYQLENRDFSNKGLGWFFQIPNKTLTQFLPVGFEYPTYTLSGLLEVPKIYLNSVPIGLDKLPVAEKKAIFIRLMLPLILEANQEIWNQRQIFLNTKKSANFSEAKRIAKIYKIDENTSNSDEMFHLLDKKVLPIPTSLALAQAAIESGWGTSRFSTEGNALYGQWSWSPNSGIKPLDASNSQAFVKSFPNLKSSVRSYMRNLNTHFAYKEFRNLRISYIKKGKWPDGLALASALYPYAETGDEYVESIKNIILQNNLQRFDYSMLVN